MAGQPAQYAAVGRPITTIPVPLPAEVGDTVDTAWLSCLGGTAALGEVYDVDAAYDHPIEHLFPHLSPSPAETWRSTDKTEQIVAFDFDRATYLGNSVALVILNANFTTAVLETSAARPTGAGPASTGRTRRRPAPAAGRPA